MIAYPDTSFLCGLYIQQSSSEKAIAFYEQLNEPLHVAGLVLFEFRQSVRFQAFQFSKDRTKGFPKQDAERGLAKLEKNIRDGAVVIVSADWADVHSIAERLSTQHTATGGHRALDILHVATALHLKARQFLTFDSNQRILAEAEGLKVKP